jgi:hypothetical protein
MKQEINRETEINHETNNNNFDLTLSTCPLFLELSKGRPDVSLSCFSFMK